VKSGKLLLLTAKKTRCHPPTAQNQRARAEPHARSLFEPLCGLELSGSTSWSLLPVVFSPSASRIYS